MNFVEGLFARECMDGTRITPCEKDEDAKKGEDDLTCEYGEAVDGERWGDARCRNCGVVAAEELCFLES